ALRVAGTHLLQPVQQLLLHGDPRPGLGGQLGHQLSRRGSGIVERFAGLLQVEAQGAQHLHVQDAAQIGLGILAVAAAGAPGGSDEPQPVVVAQHPRAHAGPAGHLPDQHYPASSCGAAASERSRNASSTETVNPESGSSNSRRVASTCATTTGSALVAACSSAGSITSPRATSARLRLRCRSWSPRPSWLASTVARVSSSPSGTSTTAARQALFAVSGSGSVSRSRVIAGQVEAAPILDRVCSAWLRAWRRPPVSSASSAGTVTSAGCRVSAQVSMSRT